MDYYESVLAKMGSEDARGFLRLFMVPPIQDCAGGSRPSSFGQFSGRREAQHDIGAALERWVEQGIASGRNVATRRKNDRDPKNKVVRTRPL